MTADPIAARPDDHALASEDDLRKVYQQPSKGAVVKNLARLDRHARRFIELSPFVCMGTMGPDGLGDVTPRGGEPGFVHVLDATHLAMPDRPGNNRLDALGNLVHNPGVGLLFLVPGFEDTLRLNGIARITRDPELMQRFVVDGKAPISVVVIEVREVYLHCTKAIKRAGLWKPESQVDRSAFPSAGQVFRDQLALEVTAATIDATLENTAKDTLY